jgi:2-C-methyl-D-erythritol 4-phosphate cytidylyltransferase
MSTGAVIVAAGRSARMGGVDKLIQSLRGRPLLAYSVAVFGRHPRIDRLVIVASQTNQAAVREIAAAEAPAAAVVLGGERRRDSVRAGLDLLEGCEYVVVHDGARPLVTPELIDAALDGAREIGAALCAVPVADTVKRSRGGGLVSGTVRRDELWLAQTPQAFRRDLLLRAHSSFDIDATDDAGLVELLEWPVKLVMGSRHNIKVTSPEDLTLAEALLALRG